MPTPETELTLAEAAALIKRRPSTLRNQIQKGRLTGRLVGKTWVVTYGELLRYVAATGRELTVG